MDAPVGLVRALLPRALAWGVLVAATLAAMVAPVVGQGGGSWRTAAPLPSSRTEVTGAELEGKIYVIGGFGGGDLVEAYDPTANRWERRAALPHGVHHASAVAVGGHLYVIGG